VTPDGYLRSVLVDGSRQFRHRGAVRALLGEAPDIGVTVTFASALPRPGFVFAAPVLARDVHSFDEEAFLSDEWLSDAVGDFDASSDDDDTTRERPGASSLAGGVARFGSGLSVPPAMPATIIIPGTTSNHPSRTPGGQPQAEGARSGFAAPVVPMEQPPQQAPGQFGSDAVGQRALPSPADLGWTDVSQSANSARSAIEPDPRTHAPLDPTGAASPEAGQSSRPSGDIATDAPRVSEPLHRESSASLAGGIRASRPNPARSAIEPDPPTVLVPPNPTAAASPEAGLFGRDPSEPHDRAAHEGGWVPNEGRPALPAHHGRPNPTEAVTGRRIAAEPVVSLADTAPNPAATRPRHRTASQAEATPETSSVKSPPPSPQPQITMIAASPTQPAVTYAFWERAHLTTLRKRILR
jgi:hypothetical protein